MSAGMTRPALYAPSSTLCATSSAVATTRATETIWVASRSRTNCREKLVPASSTTAMGTLRTSVLIVYPNNSNWMRGMTTTIAKVSRSSRNWATSLRKTAPTRARL